MTLLSQCIPEALWLTVVQRPSILPSHTLNLYESSPSYPGEIGTVTTAATSLSGPNLTIPPDDCVTFYKLFNFSVPQFPPQ